MRGTNILWLGLLVAGCGTERIEHTIDGGAADAIVMDGDDGGVVIPDAGPSFLLPPPDRLLLSRGVAGAEVLTLHQDGVAELQLSENAPPALCADKIYCNLPPDGTIGRFLWTVIQPTREHPHWTGVKSVAWDRATIASYDLVLIATNHATVNYQELADWAPCIVDTRNAMSGLDTKPGQVTKA